MNLKKNEVEIDEIKDIAVLNTILKDKGFKIQDDVLYRRQWYKFGWKEVGRIYSDKIRILYIDYYVKDILDIISAYKKYEYTVVFTTDLWPNSFYL